MSNVSTGLVVCPKCGSLGRAGDNLLMSNPPQQPYTCTNAACRHYWTERVGSAFSDGYVVPMPKTPAEKALERDEERREENHALHVQFMHKQLATMDAEAAYRAVIQAHHIRQTEALEGILRFLRESREEDLNRSRVVMD